MEYTVATVGLIAVLVLNRIVGGCTNVTNTEMVAVFNHRDS
jgi:hypothetical protein